MEQIRIVVASQKGGVGKSTIARSLAVEFSRAGWDTKIIDMDTAQGTSTKWAMRRQDKGVFPDVDVEPNRNVKKAVSKNADYDYLIFDGQPHASALTLEAAYVADLIIIPLKAGEDETAPALALAQELEGKGIERNRIAFLFNQIPDHQGITVKRTYEFMSRQGYPASDSFIRTLTCYGSALSEGRSLTEVTHPKVKDEAEEALNDIVAHLSTLKKGA